MNLPADHKPYTDKYFLRAKEVLVTDNRSPRTLTQVFIRDGNAKVYGIKEAIEIIKKYSNNSVCIYALNDGDNFESGQVVLVIDGPLQQIIELETMILGVISAETTLRNDNCDIDLKEIESHMAKLVSIAGDRPISYFGARHWRYDRDADISKACFNAGAKNCSTDIGAATIGKEGIGTIPHSLETVYHSCYGKDKAVVESTLAFDAVMQENIPRIALIDYNNAEIVDTINTARVLKEVGHCKLYGVRVDTCGENVMQSSMYMNDKSYWFGRGVSINGVYNLRKALDYSGFGDVKIILSSGFGNINKLQEFVDAEKILKTKLFDELGIGGVYYSRMATMDVCRINGANICKIGRKILSHDKLKRVL